MFIKKNSEIKNKRKQVILYLSKCPKHNIVELMWVKTLSMCLIERVLYKMYSMDLSCPFQPWT